MEDSYLSMKELTGLPGKALKRFINQLTIPWQGFSEYDEVIESRKTSNINN